MTYTQLLNQTLDLYTIEHYTEAYEFITEKSAEVEGNQAQIYNFRYSIACKAGLFDLAMAVFEEAVIGKGYWYAFDYLTTDDDLIDLRKNLRFKELAEICRDREKTAKQDSAPQLKLIGLERYEAAKLGNQKEAPQLDSPGLFIALHGNQENLEIAEPYWTPVLDEGYILALPQSSQIEFTDAYDWDDIDKGSLEIRNHVSQLLTSHTVDLSKVVIGAFSAGAGPALYAVLKDMIQVRKLIFVAPWLPEIDDWAPMLSVLKTKSISCHILCGDQDEDCLESSQAFVRQLKKGQIPYTFQIIKDLDHDFPASFDQDLLKLL